MSAYVRAERVSILEQKKYLAVSARYFFNNHGFLFVTGRKGGIAIIHSDQRKHRFSER